MSCKFHSRSTTTLLILILIGLFLVSESRQQQQDDDSPEWTSQSVTRGQFYDDQDSSRSGKLLKVNGTRSRGKVKFLNKRTEPRGFLDVCVCVCQEHSMGKWHEIE